MSNEIVLKEDSLSTNFQTFVELTLFNCDLKGIYTSTETKSKDKTTTKREILVLPTSPKPTDFSISDFLDEANNLIKSFSGTDIDMEAVKEKLKAFGFNTENIRIEIKQLFLYMETETTVPKPEPDNTPKDLEYAFSLIITNKIEPSDELKIFRINRFGIAIYRTNREFVIERMELQDISSLI